MPAPRFFAWLTALWIAVVLLLTLTPSAEMPRTPDWQLLSFDTAAHAGVFAVLTGLSWAWARARRWAGRRTAAGVLLGCVAFGGLIELLQYVMHVGRHAEWSDLLSDGIGAALVLAWPLARGSRRGAGTALLLLVGLTGPLVAAAQTPANAVQAPAASPVAPATTATSPGPDLARARRTIEMLASPKMRGRGYVGGGEHRAAAYLRGRLSRLGLQPLAPDFTQPFTLDVNTFPGEMKLTTQRRVGPSERASFRSTPTKKLVAGKDFIAGAISGAYAKRAFVISLDTTIFADTAAARGYLDYSHRVVKKCSHCPGALLLMRARDASRLATLPNATQRRINSFGQILLVPKLTASIADQQLAQPRLEVLSYRWPADTTGQEINLQLTSQLQRNYQTQNLAAIVRGTAQPESFLVVSAHYDHLGMMGKHVFFPGANDNASGVALLLELAAHYARPENQPACSVVFLLFGAEEAGLVGSTYFVAHPLVPLKQIKFLLNLDLLGTGEAGATVVNGRLHPAAFARLLALNEAGHYLPHLAARGAAANSDHFPFSEAGVPAFFMYTRGGSAAYHDVHDTPAALSLAGFAGAFGLCRDFLNQLGAR